MRGAVAPSPMPAASTSRGAHDPDDCLGDSAEFYSGHSSTRGYQPYLNSGYACGFGGDGGYWVILMTAHATVAGWGYAHLAGTPTSGFISTG